MAPLLALLLLSSLCQGLWAHENVPASRKGGTRTPEAFESASKFQMQKHSPHLTSPRSVFLVTLETPITANIRPWAQCLWIGFLSCSSCLLFPPSQLPEGFPQLSTQVTESPAETTPAHPCWRPPRLLLSFNTRLPQRTMILFFVRYNSCVKARSLFKLWINQCLWLTRDKSVSYFIQKEVLWRRAKRHPWGQILQLQME